MIPLTLDPPIFQRARLRSCAPLRKSRSARNGKMGQARLKIYRRGAHRGADRAAGHSPQTAGQSPGYAGAGPVPGAARALAKIQGQAALA